MFTEQFDRFVFIHGLNGHPIISWRSAKGPSRYLWLDDLKWVFPASRILTFGYDDILGAAADTLLSDLIDDRANNDTSVSLSLLKLIVYARMLISNTHTLALISSNSHRT